MPNTFQTTITFECDPYASWENSGVGAGEATSYLKDFFVNFENPCEVSLDYLLVHVTSHFAEIFVSEVCIQHFLQF